MVIEPLPSAVLAPEIAACLAVIAAAKETLSSTMEQVRGGCSHQIVSEMPYQSGGLPAERICNHCRFIERGSHWSGGTTWSADGYGPAMLGNDEGRLVMNITRDAFYKMRLPQ